MSNIVQQPVQYGIPSDSPIRLSGLLPPYTLINSGTSGTIWLASNPGTRPGQGTPLHPGTSLVWNRVGDLWAISDVGFTNTLIVSDVTDWEPDPAAIAAAVLNSGVILVDTPVELISRSLNGPSSLAAVDVSRYQSLTISLSLTTDNPVNAISNTVTLRFDSPDNNPYIWQVELTLEDQRWVGTVPCMGTTFQVSTGTDSTFFVSVTASHRAVETVKQQILEVDSAGAVIVNGSTVLFETLIAGGIPVGFSTITTLPPWIGELEVSSRWSAPAAAAAGFLMTTLCRNKALVNTFSIQRYDKGEIVDGVPPAAHVYALSFRVAVTGQSLQFQAVNRYAAAGANFSMRIVPVTGGLI